MAGNGINASTGDHTTARLKLSNTANTISVTTFTVAGGSGGTAGAGINIGGVTYHGVLDLGAGTNTINANNIYVGTFKQRGLIEWGGTPGAVTIRGQTGGTTRANIFVGQNLANTNTTNEVRGDINLNGASNVDIMANTLTLGAPQRHGNRHQCWPGYRQLQLR